MKREETGKSIALFAVIMDKRKLKLVLADLLLLAFFYLFSLFCCSNISSFVVPDTLNMYSVAFFYIFSAIVIIVFRYLGRIYGFIWRYAGANTYLRLIISDLAAFCVLCTSKFILPSIYIGFGAMSAMSALNCLAALGMRFCYQIIYARSHTSDDEKEKMTSHRINIAIVGAGNIGASLASDLIRNPRAHYKPICFIDVDKYKIGHQLNGLPVIAETSDIVEKIKAMPVQEIVIAMPDMDGEKRERLYNLYRQTGCKIKTYDYPLGDENDTASRKLRELSIEDLLQRESILFDNSLSKEYYKDKCVLITGGGGSIGSELCRQIAKLNASRLVILDIYENNAYDIQQELIRKYGDKLNLDVFIGSVRDVARVEEVMAECRPQIVLHAAAHKHVPLMEKSSAEAVKNNVFGTFNVANAAEKFGVEKFVLISTDKAVNPTNIMGASKRLCEMVIQCRRDSKTKFVAVRFGNVLGSNGSVIPLFKKQIEEGGPVTITDRRIIRYFMTIPEASQLVLQAGAMAKRGELFVLNMGKPVKIYDLAVNMITLSGLVPEKDIEIKEVGLRPGEKLYEELLIESETLTKTENELIYIEKDKPLSREEMNENIMKLTEALSDPSPQAVKNVIKEIVDTYKDPDEVNSQPVPSRVTDA